MFNADNIKRFILTATVFITVLLICISPAHAGILGKAKALITAEAAALALSTLLAVFGGFLGLTFMKISRTLREAGEFMAVLGDALEDKRLTREELARIVKEGGDVFMVWR